MVEERNRIIDLAMIILSDRTLVQMPAGALPNLLDIA
jgi:hypothetical protein